MLLQHKNAVVYGAGGSLGGAVAKALASAGARLFLYLLVSKIVFDNERSANVRKKLLIINTVNTIALVCSTLWVFIKKKYKVNTPAAMTSPCTILISSS